VAKFGPFRVPGTIEEVWAQIRAIASGVKDLTFGDNFISWETEVTIPAASEVAIRNQFRNSIIPTRWVVVNVEGSNSIVKGTATQWSEDFVSLKNLHASLSATVTVIFLK